MAVYNETVLAITGTASMTAESIRTMTGAVQAITGTADLSATGNLTMRPGADAITTDAEMEVDGVFVFLTQPIEGVATMSAKSLKAIWTGLQNSLMDSFVMNSKMFFLNGRDYFSYDGIHGEPVTPYIPTLAISKIPAGGGTSFEDFNLLGTGFKDSFSADGTAKDYFLSLKMLDATAVTALVNEVPKVEGTDFTVDRINGKVTFTAAPTTGTNNVIITAHKTIAGFPERIKKCTFHVLFGGTNDTRVFVSGNPDFPNMMWRSGLYDPTYFPENGFYKVGSDREKITGFSKQYDFLVIEKESSKGNMQYQLDVNGFSTFPIKPLNDHVGTIAPRSIQVIENNPISLGKTGVHLLTQSDVRDERNIRHISVNVDAKLLNEPGLEHAISIDYNRKYWLAVNDKVYVFDYGIGEWFLFDNIPASCFLEFNGDLYFGGEGRLFRFKKESELKPFDDDGVPIRAYWTSKYFTFDADHLRKVVDRIFFSMKPSIKTSADLYYTTNKKVSDLIKTKRMDQLDFFRMDFNFFSFIRSTFPQEVMVRIKAKKITHFQLRIINDKPDESLGLISLGIKFRYGSQVK